MIIREWRGRASHANQDAYPEHFRRNVAPELRNVEGFLGARLFRQDRDDEIEYLVLSQWASLEAIAAFAGDDIGEAVVEPGAVAALVDCDDRVRHYSLVEEVRTHDEDRAA